MLGLALAGRSLRGAASPLNEEPHSYELSNHLSDPHSDSSWDHFRGAGRRGSGMWRKQRQPASSKASNTPRKAPAVNAPSNPAKAVTPPQAHKPRTPPRLSQASAKPADAPRSPALIIAAAIPTLPPPGPSTPVQQEWDPFIPPSPRLPASGLAAETTPFPAVEPFADEAWCNLEESSWPRDPPRRRNLVPYVAATLILAITICVAAGIRFNQERSANAATRAIVLRPERKAVDTQAVGASPKASIGPSGPVSPSAAGATAAGDLGSERASTTFASVTAPRTALALLPKRAPASRNDASLKGPAAQKAAGRPARAVPHAALIVGDAPF